MSEWYTFSQHAGKRCQQRGIGNDVIDAVLAFGSVLFHGGSKKYYMDKRARERARREMDATEFRRIADRLNIYLVVSDATIVTVANLRTRIRVSKPHRPTRHPRSRK